MATLAVDFTWRRARDGYELREGRVYPKGRELEEHRPLEYHPTLYAQFADLDDDPAAFLSFTNDFGPLSHDAEFIGESLHKIRAWRAFMARLISVRTTDPNQLLRFDDVSQSRSAAINKSWSRAIKKSGGGLKRDPEHSFLPNLAANIVAVLQPGPPDGRPMLSLQPDTLWDAMLLQFEQSVSSGAALKECGWCREWFEVGGPTGKRADARFCSGDCRVKAHVSAKNDLDRHTGKAKRRSPR